MGLWEKCLGHLEAGLSAQEFNNWIRPLHAIEDSSGLRLLAPNRFVLDWVYDRYLSRINEIIGGLKDGLSPQVTLEVGGRHTGEERVAPPTAAASTRRAQPGDTAYQNTLNADYTFNNFIAGKSNQLAHAAACQVGEQPGSAYNPLFIYGGVGLGKTHLLHGIGNHIKQIKPDARVVYLHSERFVADMVKALQHNTMADFKRFYRTVDTLLIDDIQFFAGKERSQEEFFHTFNALLEGQRQVVLTCDRYPKEVRGLEERLVSRVGWGLSVVIEPAELETRVAILMSKAALAKVSLPHEVAFFIAKRFRSNIRELEGALRRVVANSNFTGQPISLDFAKDALRDLLAIQDKQVTIENIQKTVAEYYKIRVADLLSPQRTRNLARPRQMAMALSKELTSHSLPEIGRAFGGRDHTTVLHASRKVTALRESDTRFGEDHSILVRTLTT